MLVFLCIFETKIMSFNINDIKKRHISGKSDHMIVVPNHTAASLFLLSLLISTEELLVIKLVPISALAEHIYLLLSRYMIENRTRWFKC